MNIISVEYEGKPAINSIDGVAQEDTTVRIRKSIATGECVLYIDDANKTVVRLGHLKPGQITITEELVPFINME